MPSITVLDQVHFFFLMHMLIDDISEIMVEDLLMFWWSRILDAIILIRSKTWVP
jgi:hypothetical protein